MAGVAPFYPVDGPAPVRLPYGIETVATVIAEPGDRFLGGTAAWRYALGAATYDIDRCIVLASPPQTKPTERMPGQNTDDPYQPFGVRVGLDCTGLLLASFEEFQRRVQVPLEAEEWAVVEAELFTSHADNTSLQDAAVVSGPAAAVLGLGELEQGSAVATRTRGILHMSRRAATVFSYRQVLVERQGQLQTVIGTPVCVSGEYDPAANPTAGGAPANGHSEYIYWTAPIHVRRTTMQWVGDEPRQVLDRGDNLAEVRLERWYTLTFDHDAVYAQQVDLTAL